MITKLKYIVAATLMFCSISLTTSCKDDDGFSSLPAGQGEVSFKFVKNTVYSANKLEQMTSIKITLQELATGDKMILPSLTLTGNLDSISTPAIQLKAGEYKVISYKSFTEGNLFEEIELEENNDLLIVDREPTSFYVPIDVKLELTDGLIKNVLLGVCLEVFGNDTTLWPKTWRPENSNLAEWENLQFALDANDNPMYLETVTFDKKFAPMTKLPNSISKLVTLDALVISDNNLEELPTTIGEMNLTSLAIINTKLKSLPVELFELELGGITIVNSELTEIPEEISNVKKLSHIAIVNAPLTTLPESLKELTELRSFQINATQIANIPDIFGSIPGISTLNLSYNANLATLPASVAAIRNLRAVYLDGCAFTTIPTILRDGSIDIRHLSMRDNQLKTIDLAGFNNLQELHLDGNKFTSFPQINSAILMGLSLSNCEMTALPNLAGLPALIDFEFGNNKITSLPENCFAANSKMTKLNLMNSAELKSLPTNFGFELNESNQPHLFRYLNVKNCAQLTWKVPATWCDIAFDAAWDNIYTEEGETILSDQRCVIVDRDGSPSVTRKTCSACFKGSTPPGAF